VDYRRPAPAARALTTIVGPDDPAGSGLTLVCGTLGFGATHAIVADEAETLVVVMGGRIHARVGDWTARGVGARLDPFGGAPHALYVPRDAAIEIMGASSPDADLAIVRVPAARAFAPVHILPTDVSAFERGAANWRRLERSIVDGGFAADRLIAGETLVDPGNWSEVPPARDAAAVGNGAVVRVHHLRLAPSSGFALQYLYGAGREADVPVVLRDRDSVVIPGGYFPLVAAPGHAMYYVWAIAGPARALLQYEDPQYAWLQAAERVVGRRPTP